MTGPAGNLPEDALDRIARKKQEALEAETHALEEVISTSIESRISERRRELDARIADRRKSIEEASARSIAELQSFAEHTLRRLEAERERRHAEHAKEEQRKRSERLLKEKQEEEARKKKAAADDPSVKVKTILRQVQSHMERGDMELAAKLIADGLEIDGFNAELLELDAKVREAMASDTFTPGATPAAAPRKEKSKPARTKPAKAKPAKTPSPPSEPGAPARRGIPGWAFTVLGAALLGGAALVAYFAYAPRPLEKNTTLAVIPWKTSGEGEELAVLGAGLPEIVLRTLSTGGSSVGLLGYNTTSNLASMGKDPLPPLVRLGYSHFLRGTLSKRDSIYSVHVELSDSSGTTHWSGDYRRDMAGLVIVPREIAHSLRGFFLNDGPSVGTAVEIKNTESYLLYLQGLISLRESGGAGADSALGAFQRSIGLDSTRGETYAGLANALLAGNANLAGADSAARLAVRLDPSGADGYVAMGRVRIEQRRYEDALELLDSAAARAPGLSTIPYLRGMAFFRSGQPDQALESLQRAFRLDPRNSQILDLIATVHQIRKSFDQALWYRETAMFFSGDSLRYLAGPVADLIMLDPTLILSHGPRVTSACYEILGQDHWDYPVLYSLARTLQGSGNILESLTFLNSLDSLLRARVRANPEDTRARMHLALTLTRLGKYADAIALGEATAAADSTDARSLYMLARIHALQMYSPQTKTVDEARQTRAIALLRLAVERRFIDSELCSADLYNIYHQSDIRRAFGTEPAPAGGRQ